MKKKVDKNLVLMDDILEVIGQSDEWEDIQLHDPRIVAANKALKAEMEALQLPFNEYCGLEMAIGQATAMNTLLPPQHEGRHPVRHPCGLRPPGCRRAHS